MLSICIKTNKKRAERNISICSYVIIISIKEEFRLSNVVSERNVKVL